MAFESEIAKPFPEAPTELSAFFRNNVERLLLENLDYLTTDSWDTKSLEALYLIDEFPIRGEPLRYHYVYHLFDSFNDISTLGLVAANPHVIKGFERFDRKALSPWASRKNSTRHYFDSGQGLGVVALHYKTAGLITEVLEKAVEDPHLKEDPLDVNTTRALKADIEAFKRATPIKPMSNLVRQFVRL